MTHKSILALISIILISVACKRDPLAVDASKTMVNIEYLALDSMLMQSDSVELLGVYQKMKESIPELFDYQVGYCFQIGKVNDTAFVSQFLEYKRDSFIQKLEKEIEQKFPKPSQFNSRINTGFKHLKTHLPTVKLPKNVVYMNSLFASNAFSTETEIGIGLERYLGVKSPSIQRLPSEPFYTWVKEGMEAKFLERDALASWIMTHVVAEEDGNLAQKIIRWGKIMYLTQAAFPDIDESILMRYSEEDFKWATENEYSLWKYLIDEELLFKLDEKIAQNLLADGPFTPGLPEKGPDRLGQYLGWRMVKNYMENSETSFETLLKMPYNDILQAYKVE